VKALSAYCTSQEDLKRFRVAAFSIILDKSDTINVPLSASSPGRVNVAKNPIHKVSHVAEDAYARQVATGLWQSAEGVIAYEHSPRMMSVDNRSCHLSFSSRMAGLCGGEIDRRSRSSCYNSSEGKLPSHFR